MLESSQHIGIIGFLATVVLVLLGLPVGISMACIGLVGFAILNGLGAMQFVLGTAVYDSVSNYSISVIPLFLMMGVFASRTRLSSDLFRFVSAFVGHVRGGLAMATIGACAGFGAICGSSLATVATISPAAMPEMKSRGYSLRLAAGSIAAGGTLGILIPPSIILVVYALLTEQSLGTLFIAALLPGVLGTLLYMLAIFVQVRIWPQMAPSGPRATWRERRRTTLEVWPILALFGTVMGGIYGGIFTPTEAAAVGASGAVLISVLSGGLTWGVIKDCIIETIELSGMIFLVMMGAKIFNFFIETTGLAELVVDLVTASGLSPLGTMALLIICYIALGCVMDALAIILLTVPVVFPLVLQLGIDPIWFGIVIVMVTEIGLITPPVGMNLFVIQGVNRDLRTSDVMMGALPFVVSDVVRILILLFVPAVALWLPQTMN
jgi:tripartite ATP-independent transporter DctM subunit